MSFAGYKYKVGISGYLYIVGLLIAFHYTENIKNVASGQTSEQTSKCWDLSMYTRGTTLSFLIIVETLIDIIGLV